jgi:imidazolonepropionase-like amidohydrolase
MLHGIASMVDRTSRRIGRLPGRLTLTLAGAASLGVASPVATLAAQAQGRVAVALQAGRVLDPVSGRYSPARTILVRDGRITAVIPTDQYRPGMADTVVDVRALTVMPGLIDAHVHLTIGGGVAASALADLRAGFTTVVDLGARTHRLLALRDSINRGEIPGPRVLAAGVWVGVKGGVCEFNGIGIAGGVDAFRERIRANARAGAEVAKLCVSGWPAEAFAEPTKYELNDEVIRASAAEAHDAHQIVVAHDISLGGVRAALAAGIDGLAHAAYLDSAAADHMRAAHVFMIPTLASLSANDTSPGARALVAAVRMAHRRGVPIVFGTDGGVLPHGRNAEEFRALIGAGLSPLEAVRAATINAAAAFRLRDSVGTVGPGMVADLIAVRGDPLSDVASLLEPVLVMSRGHVVRAP